MRFVNDRLSQLARIAGGLTQPKTGENWIDVPGIQSAIVELPDPARIGGSAAATFGSLAAPVAESIIFHDVVDLSGVAGLDSRTLATFSPGLWHVSFQKGFEFTGTSNLAKAQTLNFTVADAQLGTIIFTANLFSFKFVTGSRRDVVRDFWLNLLAPWSLISVTTNTVAGDELHSYLSVVANRFI